jgi:hypothetical protein
VKSNNEELEVLQARCNLFNDTLAKVIKGRDAKLLSDDLWNSIGRLVKYVPLYVKPRRLLTNTGARGIHDILMGTMMKKSKGITAYILVEDDAEALKRANKQIDDILRCFWVIAVQLL